MISICAKSRAKDPADGVSSAIEKVSVASMSLSEKTGSIIVSEVKPAKMVILPVVAVKSDPAVALSPN